MIPPVFVLVRPQMGENIGGAARAMLNFGLERMRVVDPRDGWPNPKAVAMASGAGRVLDHAGLFGDLDTALADCDFVLATTARGRELTKPIYTPEAAMALVRATMTVAGSCRAASAALISLAERKRDISAMRTGHLPKRSTRVW